MKTLEEVKDLDKDNENEDDDEVPLYPYFKLQMHKLGSKISQSIIVIFRHTKRTLRQCICECRLIVVF